MLFLINEEYEKFYNFIEKIIFSNINKSFMFESKYNNYTFEIGCKVDKLYNKLIISFEFDKELNLSDKNVEFVIIFYYDNVKKKIKFRYSDDEFKMYNSLVSTLNYNNINKLIYRINYNLQCELKDESMFLELLNFNLENLTIFFEKNLINHND